MREEESGLYIEGKLDLSLYHGKKAYDLVKGGIIDGLSIGFDIIKYKKEGSFRCIEKLRLIEISVVSLPSNPKAKIFYVKSASGTKKIDKIISDFKSICAQN
ncbi:HK97 family phage prohead protease [Candidatus Cyrtobacter comes]|uniref:HK97 family phage prohead protease n=2 Tax=Candidatus Cyrtobacter comes TaxID=675776 RepID=A0ABU5L7P3_9RICK|nr:HK97 family phage prohead protease [Candidatus Cyrtobacter comes]